MRACAVVLTAVLIAAAPWPGAVSVSAGQAGDSVEALLARAQELSRAYDYEGALALTEAALRIDPLDDAANSMLRSLHGRLGSGGSLEARYRELVAAYPDSAAAYYLLGLVPGPADRQEAYLRLALQLDPTYAPAALALARRLRRPEHADSALRLFSELIASRPGDYATAASYVSLLEQLHRGDEAIAFLKQMTARYPDELRFWTSLWMRELHLGSSDRERAFERLRPQINAQRYRFMDSMEHMEMLARILDRVGGPAGADAVELWQSIAERYPDHPRAELALLRAVSGARDVDTKRSALQALIDSYPASPVRYAAYQDIINTLIREERYDEAIDLAKTLLELPDPGYAGRGVWRDPMVMEMAIYGNSLECLGYAGWFAAAQAPLAQATRQRIDWYGISSIGGPDLDREIAIAPEAAAAAQGLASSRCDDIGVLFAIGVYTAGNAAFRTLGIEMMERAVEISRNTPPNDPDFRRSFFLIVADRYRELLPYLYLRDGRLEDAQRAVDRLFGESSARSSRFYRIAGEVYEAAGRLEDAKRAYLRGLSSGADREFVQAALDRLYRALSSTELVVLDAGDAPRLPIAGTRVTRVRLGIEAPARRFVNEGATLVLLWNVRQREGRAQAEALAASGDTLTALGVGTLSIAVDVRAASAVRYLNRNPLPDGIDESVAMTYDDLVAWGFEELPITALIDGDGRVLARQMSYGVSPADWLESWRSAVATVLGERRPMTPGR